MDARAWLLTSDEPSVRLRALLDLDKRDARDPDVLAARAELPERGWGARLLADLQVPDGPRGLYLPKYVAPFHVLLVLAEMGVPRTHPRLAPVLDQVLAVYPQPDGGFSGRPGAGKGHLCVTANLMRALVRFGMTDDPLVANATAWLLAAQMPDGGWDCWPEVTKHGTVDAWHPLAALAEISPARRSAPVRAAIARGAEFLLAHRLGMDEGYAPRRRLHWPRHYYYDVLAGLDLVTSLGVVDDPRLAPALDLLRARRGADGRWPLDAHHPDLEPGEDYTPYAPGVDLPILPLALETPGQPSQMVTLTALRVLDRVGG